MTETLSFKMIPLKDLVPSPTNPRKFFDVDKTQELSLSINEKGVLQPILVRPKGDKYEIVAGERRYRASKLVPDSPKVNGVIPATIRELDDQEVREMQLIENFQRQDVHPMEEAVAIKAAIDSGKYQYEDIAAKVGKKLTYIRQRMKLNELTAEWQKMFFRNGISVGDAFKLCALPAVHQKEIFKDQVGKDDGQNKHSLNSWVLDKYKGELNHAAFDLTDATLDKKMGACSGCQFNTAVNELFPELADKPRCTNISCFKHKGDVYFDRELKKAKEDPTIILIYDSYGKVDIVEKLRKEGVEVLKEGYSDDCRALRAPEKPDWDSYEEENYDEDDPNEAQLKEEFEQELKSYEKDKEAFDKKVGTGKYKKAFMVYDSGWDTGKYLYVEMNQKGANKDSKKAVEEGTAGVSDIEAEIVRIKERERRSKELDGEKVWREINKLASDKSLFHDGELSTQELTALAVAFYSTIGYSNRGKIEKLLNKSSDLSIAKSTGLVTQKLINHISRIFISSCLSNITGSHLKNGNQMALKAVIEQYLPDQVKTLEADQGTRAEKRNKNVEKRITELQDKKKELQKEAKKTTEPKAPKKAAVKKAPAAVSKKKTK